MPTRYDDRWKGKRCFAVWDREGDCWVPDTERPTRQQVKGLAYKMNRPKLLFKECNKCGKEFETRNRFDIFCKYCKTLS